jgi:translation initiation factor eIF-2B subunit gamma
MPPLPTGVKLPGPKNKVKQERDIVGLRPGNNQLIFMASEADFEDNLNIPVEVLFASPHTKINTSLMDAHVYLLKRDLLERYVLTKETADLLSVKGEFLPHLIAEQLKNFDKTDGVNHFLQPAVDKSNPEAEKVIPVTLFGFMSPNSNAIRVNTVAAYSSACKSAEWLKQTFPEAGARPKETQISKTAKLIAAQLGDQCTVGEKVKLVNVIAMDNITFEEGCQVENSVISCNAIIGAKSVVKECLVGPGYQVPEGGRFVNENLTVMEETLFED